ncbi:MAG: hypothetical protein ACHQLA_03740 [Ignavibacteriales bacterium]
MTTLSPPGTIEFPESSIEKKVYNVVEKFGHHIPEPNDKNRLGFGLYKFMKGEGDPPGILLRSAKIKVVGIQVDVLAEQINTELKKIS